MPTRMQPAITTIALRTDPGNGTPENPGLNNSYLSYVDTARELSKINRRLYSQSRMYGYQGLTFIWRSTGSTETDVATIECSVRTAGNTWVVQNAHTKGKALWNDMQALVLKDNPSISGKWHDFKLLLNAGQASVREMFARDGAGNEYASGEWDLSTYVMPQHVVDPATGQPLPAVEYTAMLIGGDTSTKRSLVKAYQESRATLNSNSPNVPPGMSDSFFNLLTDSGSQEPELASVIENEGDNPPYDLTNYSGGAVNAPAPVTVGYAAISNSEVDGRIGSFVAPCGLLQIEIKGYDSAGVAIEPADMPAIDLLLHVAPGSYKGVASVPMGQ